MKTNKKVLAGALALALGLGAVVPAFATEETKPANKAGYVVMDEDYRVAEANFQAAYNALVAAKKNTAEKEANLEAKKKALKEAEDALADFEAGRSAVLRDAKHQLEKIDTYYAEYLADKTIDHTPTVDQRVSAARALINDVLYTLTKVIINGENFEGLEADLNRVRGEIDYITKLAPWDVAGQSAAANVGDIKASIDFYAQDVDELATKYNAKKRATLMAKVDRREREVNEALNDLRTAQAQQEVAQKKYDNAKAAFVDAGAKADVIVSYEKQGVKPAEEKPAEEKPAGEDKKPEKPAVDAEKIAKLEESLKKLEQSKKGLEFLEALAPDIIAKHQAEYDVMLEKLDKTIKASEAALKLVKETKTSFLFTTAYAAEEGEEIDIDALIKANEEVNQEAQDFIKGLNDEAKDDKPAEEKPSAEKPAEEKPAEEKPAEEKPAEEKPSAEKPAAEKPAEEKPAAEKPAEEKPAAEKPADEKPADEKPADEKPADDTNAPADKDEKPADDKKATVKVTVKKNPKTGVASVAGVAAVLAAASAAYVDSKRK